MFYLSRLIFYYALLPRTLYYKFNPSRIHIERVETSIRKKLADNRPEAVNLERKKFSIWKNHKFLVIFKVRISETKTKFLNWVSKFLIKSY